MKFGKEYASQMVPEWQEAYMDYEFLKTLLKEIKLSRQRNQSAAAGLSVLSRNFSGLIHPVNSPRAQTSSDQIENEAIIAHNVRRGEEEQSETMFLNAADDGAECEVVYFKKLDDEFNNVMKFYKVKVEDVMNEASVLNKQMEALVAFRVKVENPTNSFEDANQLSNDPSAGGASKGESSIKSDESGQNERRAKRAAPLEILQHVKLNTSQETPLSTIKRFLNLSNQRDLKFSKDNLKISDNQIKKAFVEFYHKLRLLKSYRFLNITAFSKIMKKYDKIASRNASRPYMKMVYNSYLGSFDEVSKLMESVENTFIKHFANSNRSKGMNMLRPKKKREMHRISFAMGFLFGCTVALILASALIIRARNILDKEGRELYMDTMFPLYSLYGFIVLHMLMYAANIYLWRRYRVNYSFIFGFKQGTELGYREVLLLGFCLSVLALASVLANLDMEMDPITQDYQAITELVPLGLLVMVFLFLLCPLNIIYRSSRFFLLVCLFHCFFAPLYTVTFAESFLADQVTSQIQALRSLEFYICYYGWGDYKRRQNSCKSNDVFHTFSYIIAAIPYWSRLLQCLRRLHEEKDHNQAYNGLKYLSTIIAVCARTTYTLNKGVTWKIIALITSIIATIFGTYWDIVMDWGLFQLNSKNRWLREKLLIPHKSVYFLAMVLNVLLRLAWIQTVLDITIPSLHSQTVTALVAALEIIRRGLWNFFRLENEHLHNVGKFRAFKSVPLPFYYDEDEEEDKDD